MQLKTNEQGQNLITEFFRTKFVQKIIYSFRKIVKQMKYYPDHLMPIMFLLIVIKNFIAGKQYRKQSTKT